MLQPAMPRHAMHATPCKLCCIMPRSCQSVRPSCVQLMHTMHTLPGHGASWQDAAFTGTTLPAKPLAAFQPRANTATPYRPSHARSLHGCMQPCMGYMAWLPLCSCASTCWLQGRLRAGGQHHAHPGESERCPSWVCWLAAFGVSRGCLLLVGGIRCLRILLAMGMQLRFCTPQRALTPLTWSCSTLLAGLAPTGQLQLCGAPAAGAPPAHVGGSLELVPAGCSAAAAWRPRPLLVGGRSGVGCAERKHEMAWHGMAWNEVSWQGELCLTLVAAVGGGHLCVAIGVHPCRRR